MAPPQREKFPGQIAFAGVLAIHTDSTRLNVIRTEDASQVQGRHGVTIVPGAPSPGLVRIQVIQQNESGTVMLVLVNEQVADIREQMHEASLGCVLAQDPEQRIADMFGRLAADEIGTMEEGFHQVLLAWSQVGRELVAGEGDGFMQGAGVLHDPTAEPGQQGRGLGAGLRGDGNG